MKSLIAAALLCASFAASADAVLTGPNGTYRLTERACEVPIALASVKPEHAANQRAGWLEKEGKTLAFCWVVHGDTVYAMDENGDIHAGPASEFRPAKGI